MAKETILKIQRFHPKYLIGETTDDLEHKRDRPVLEGRLGEAAEKDERKEGKLLAPPRLFR